MWIQSFYHCVLKRLPSSQGDTHSERMTGRRICLSPCSGSIAAAHRAEPLIFTRRLRLWALFLSNAKQTTWNMLFMQFWRWTACSMLQCVETVVVKRKTMWDTLCVRAAPFSVRIRSLFKVATKSMVCYLTLWHILACYRWKFLLWKWSWWPEKCQFIGLASTSKSYGWHDSFPSGIDTVFNEQALLEVFCWSYAELDQSRHEWAIFWESRRRWSSVSVILDDWIGKHVL